MTMKVLKSVLLQSACVSLVVLFDFNVPLAQSWPFSIPPGARLSEKLPDCEVEVVISVSKVVV